MGRICLILTTVSHQFNFYFSNDKRWRSFHLLSWHPYIFFDDVSFTPPFTCLSHISTKIFGFWLDIDIHISYFLPVIGFHFLNNLFLRVKKFLMKSNLANVLNCIICLLCALNLFLMWLQFSVFSEKFHNFNSFLGRWFISGSL